MELSVNGDQHHVEADRATPLLNVLRNDLGLMGAKRGCAQEQCYACCVLVDGRTQPIRPAAPTPAPSAAVAMMLCPHA